MHSLSNGGYYLLGNPGAATQMHRLIYVKEEWEESCGRKHGVQARRYLVLEGAH